MNNPYIVQTSTIYVQAAFDNNFTADVRGVLLDTSKAFDNVWHNELLFKLKSYGVEDQLLSLLENCLANRQQRVVFNGQTSSWENINSRVPQGSVLCPLLFLI